MNNILSKKIKLPKLPKLKWWQIGALIALIMVVLYLYLVWQASLCHGINSININKIDILKLGHPEICPVGVMVTLLYPFFLVLVGYLIILLFIWITIKFRGRARLFLIVMVAILVIICIYYFFHIQIEKVVYKINPEMGIRTLVYYCEKLNPIVNSFESKDYCYIHGIWSMEVEEFSLCEKIEDPDYKSGCYKMTSKYPITEGEISDRKTAVERCEKMSEGMWEHSRYEPEYTSFPEDLWLWDETYCYQKLAEALKDYSICEEVQRLDSRDRCWLAVSESKVVLIEDPNVCEEIEKEADWIQIKLCYENTFFNAFNARNIDFCEKVKDQLYKDKCYVKFEYYMNDLSDCEKIQHQYYKDHCYLDFILKQYPRDIKESEAITRLTAFCREMFLDSHPYSQRGRDVCYFNIVNYGMDPGYKYRGWEYCKLIQAQDLKQECEKIMSRISSQEE